MRCEGQNLLQYSTSLLCIPKWFSIVTQHL